MPAWLAHLLVPIYRQRWKKEQLRGNDKTYIKNRSTSYYRHTKVALKVSRLGDKAGYKYVNRSKKWVQVEWLAMWTSSGNGQSDYWHRQE